MLHIVVQVVHFIILHCISVHLTLQRGGVIKALTKAMRGPGPAGKPTHVDVDPLLGHADAVLAPDAFECLVQPVPIEHVLCHVLAI